MAKENELETKAIQAREIDLEYKKLKMRCLEISAELRTSGDPELIELKAEHFYNWIVNGDKR